MITAEQTFFSWFEQPIRTLQNTDGCAFGVVILCFPLLERYLRQTSGCGENDLTDKFYDDLIVVFSELNNRAQARQFWHVYRNGLLHQGAFSAQNRKGIIMPYAAISGETPRIYYDVSGDTFYVNPVLFSDAVLDFIRDDLACLAASAASNHEIPSAALPYFSGTSGMILNTPATGNFIPMA